MRCRQLLLTAQRARRRYQILPASYSSRPEVCLRLQSIRPRVLSDRRDGQGPLLLPQGHLFGQSTLQRVVRHQHDTSEARKVPARREVFEEGAADQPA